MNHELVHVATTDIANAQDRAWRRFFGGKVPPQSQHPESLLYSYLTVPRFTVPRWYLEGSAVFMETWMDGGFGRAQGGYDEMVFRAMVRDARRSTTRSGSSRAASASTSRSAPTPTSTARASSVPRATRTRRKGARVAAARRRQRAPLRRPVRARVRHAARRGVAATGSRSSSDVPARQPRSRCASTRSRLQRQLVANRARLGLACLLRRGDRHAVRRRSAIRASSNTSARSTPATAAVRRARRHQGRACSTR